MVRDPYALEELPPAREVLEALADEDARTIIRTLDEPMTAQELQDRCDIPESTLYRKLERLTNAGLLHQRTRIRRDGRHANEYLVAFSEITVERDGDTGEVTLEMTPTSKSPDERLAELWTEVSREV